MTLEVGQNAPLFTLPYSTDDTLSLDTLRGQKVVLYFYPRDNTPGCTLEAQDFTALAQEFRDAGTRVLGISKDSLKKHANFSAKYSLDVTLLSDEAGGVCEDYGVWVEKKNYGRSYMGIERTSFLVDAEGRIARIWHKVKVKGHAQEVLEAALAL